MKTKGLFVLFTSYLPMLGSFLRVLRLLPPLALVAIQEIAEILLKLALNTKDQSNQSTKLIKTTLVV